MKCAACGGRMEWKGMLFNLTHKECVRCGSTEEDFDNGDEEVNDSEDAN